MPIRIPTDTRSTLGDGAQYCDSRSLLLDRFVYDHPDMDEARKLHFARVCEDSFSTIYRTRSLWESVLRDPKAKENKKQSAKAFLEDTKGLSERKSHAGTEDAEILQMSRRSFLSSLPRREVLYAQLQSRLMVNMAGGVMENAGLCIDRFGLPYIPGSAVKGCARKAALAALHEWCETEQKPGGTEDDKDNLFTEACASFASPAEMLVAVAGVFGWSELDWDISKLTKRGHVGSDYAWAVGRELWPQVLLECGRKLLCKVIQYPKDFGHFAGGVSFLSAYPVDLAQSGKPEGLPLDVPNIGKLELDVITVHHQKYYAEPSRTKKQREWAKWNREWSDAPDTEEPVPVVFPAVAPGHVFVFSLLPMRVRLNDPNLVTYARKWLRCGLQTLGIGAKTASGYGWFDASEKLHKAITESQEKAVREREAASVKAEKEAAEQARLKQEQAQREARRASLVPDPNWQQKFREKSEPDRRAIINQFAFDDPKFWPDKGELMDEAVQFSLLHFLLKVEPDFLAADRSNAKSKMAKALGGLKKKYPSLI